MEENDSDNVIMTMRHSRKAFLVEYVCSIFLLSLLLIALFKKIDLPALVSMSILGMGLAGIAGTELRRFFGDRYKIMPTKLLIIKGVLKVKKRNIYYLRWVLSPILISSRAPFRGCWITAPYIFTPEPIILNCGTSITLTKYLKCWRN